VLVVQEERLLIMRTRGFTLIETLIVMSILGLLLAAGLPTLADFMKNQRMRGVAEQVRDGMSLARLEAIRRNTAVNFVPNATGWSVVVPASGTTAAVTIATRAPLAQDTDITATPTSAQVAFNGSGRLTAGTTWGVAVTQTGLTCLASGGTARCLNVNVVRGGDVRMCDPAQPSSKPEAC
jgi:type IV fimbrial biogenesis protein FimT